MDSILIVIRKLEAKVLTNLCQQRMGRNTAFIGNRQRFLINADQTVLDNGDGKAVPVGNGCQLVMLLVGSIDGGLCCQDGSVLDVPFALGANKAAEHDLRQIFRYIRHISRQMQGARTVLVFLHGTDCPLQFSLSVSGTVFSVYFHRRVIKGYASLPVGNACGERQVNADHCGLGAICHQRVADPAGSGQFRRRHEVHDPLAFRQVIRILVRIGVDFLIGAVDFDLGAKGMQQKRIAPKVAIVRACLLTAVLVLSFDVAIGNVLGVLQELLR